jgi:hypothetical protein
MKAKLILENGKEIEIELTAEQEKLVVGEKKKTGYERVEEGEICFSSDPIEENGIGEMTDNYLAIYNSYYESADYYSDEEVAINNARADKLMRQLRRFAVENAENELDWKKDFYSQYKWYIYYSYEEQVIGIDCNWTRRNFGQIYFDHYETTQKAIDTFKDELIWYFTEYRDRV